MRGWESEIEASDTIMVAGLARTLEDLLDANPTVLVEKPQAFRYNHAARKRIRARRPQT
jgi:hypothetical protein